MAKIKMDAGDAGLRDIIKYEMTHVTGSLEFRISHLIEALNRRAELISLVEKREKIMRNRAKHRNENL